MTKNTVNTAENGALVEAVKCGIPDFHALFLSRGANANVRDSSDRTLLHIAVEEQRSGNAALLLVHGAALDATNSIKQTPLILAIIHGIYAMVTLLLTHDRKNINAGSVDGYTPLIFAVKNNSAAITTILESGADIETKCYDQRTALHIAIDDGCTEAAKCLLKAGAYPKACNRSGQTPLHRLVVGCSKESLVYLLVRYRANIEAMTDDGSTPLLFAASKGKSRIVEALASHNANMNPESHRALFSPLIKATTAGYAKTVRVLLQHGVVVHQKTNDGYSAVGLAASKGHSNVVKVLLEYRANINTGGGSSGTPLIRAVQSGHLAVAELLLDRRANIEAACTLGMRALHHACDGENENSGMVELLLRRKANIEARFTSTWEPRKSKTPLHFGAMKGCYYTTKVLLDHGANPQARNHLEKTPQDLVYEHCKDNPSQTYLIDLLARSIFTGRW